MAAYKCGAKTVIIPSENLADVNDFEDEIKNALEFVPITHVSEVFARALV